MWYSSFLAFSYVINTFVIAANINKMNKHTEDEKSSVLSTTAWEKEIFQLTCLGIKCFLAEALYDNDISDFQISERKVRHFIFCRAGRHTVESLTLQLPKFKFWSMCKLIPIMVLCFLIHLPILLSSKEGYWTQHWHANCFSSLSKEIHQQIMPRKQKVPLALSKALMRYQIAFKIISPFWSSLLYAKPDTLNQVLNPGASIAALGLKE